MNPQKSIDPEVLAGYNLGLERNRLRAGLGLIEFARTCELLDEFLPSPPAVIYDIGGGYGEYAYFLANRGYDVYLYDLAEANIALSSTPRREEAVNAPPLRTQYSDTGITKKSTPRG